MAEAVEHTLRKALIAHEPEAAPLPVVFRTSWRVFTSHLRFLLTTAAATAAIPLLVVLALTAIFGPIIQPPTDQPFPWGPPNLDSHGKYSPAPAPHGHYAPAPAPDPTPAPKVNPVAFAVATAVNFLLSAGAHVILIAVFVYVVLGDHVGRKPGPVWGVIKGSFWRLIGTDIAQSLVTILVTFVLGALVALIGGVVTGVFFKGTSPNFAAATTLVIWLVLALPATLFIIVGLSLADQATAVEGAGLWGFAALRRSWTLSKGSRAAILAVVLLSALVSIVLGSPLEILVNNFQDGSALAGTWWQVLLAILGALVVFLLSVFTQAYLQVVWVELYLASRKKAEPEFGLSAIERYFEAGAAGSGGYSQARTWDA